MFTQEFKFQHWKIVTKVLIGLVMILIAIEIIYLKSKMVFSMLFYTTLSLLIIFLLRPIFSRISFGKTFGFSDDEKIKTEVKRTKLTMNDKKEYEKLLSEIAKLQNKCEIDENYLARNELVAEMKKILVKKQGWKT